MPAFPSPSTMKLSAAFSILLDLCVGIQVAFLPTLQAIIASPSLFFRPAALSRSFMANLWVTFGKGVDENGRPLKTQLITPNAHGVVLDIGAGCTVFYMPFLLLITIMQPTVTPSNI